jgi:hypothetical protein
MNHIRLVRYVPTEQDKIEALGSVFYEIQQMHLASRLQTPAQPVSNALIESTLVHVRALIDFFENSERSTYRVDGMRYEHDDVLAADYGFNARALDIAPQHRERLNKDLVHLSYARNTRRSPELKPWPVPELVLPLIDRSIEFIDSLGEPLLRQVARIPLTSWHSLRTELHAVRAASLGASQ